MSGEEKLPDDVIGGTEEGGGPSDNQPIVITGEATVSKTGESDPSADNNHPNPAEVDGTPRSVVNDASTAGPQPAATQKKDVVAAGDSNTPQKSSNNPLYDGLSDFSNLLTNALASIDGNVDQLKGSQTDTVDMLRALRTRVDVQELKLTNVAAETEQQRAKVEFALRNIAQLQKSLESQLSDATKQMHKELVTQRTTTKMDLNSLQGNLNRSMSEVVSMMTNGSKIYSAANLPAFDPSGTTQDSIKFLVDRLGKLEEAMGFQQSVNEHLSNSVNDNAVIQKVYDSLYDQITALEEELQESKSQNTDTVKQYEDDIKYLRESNEDLQRQVSLMAGALCSKQKLKEFRNEQHHHHHHHHHHHSSSSADDGEGQDEAKHADGDADGATTRQRSARKMRSARRKRSARPSSRTRAEDAGDTDVLDDEPAPPAGSDEVAEGSVNNTNTALSRNKKPPRKSPRRSSSQVARRSSERKRRSRAAGGGSLREIDVVDSDDEYDLGTGGDEEEEEGEESAGHQRRSAHRRSPSRRSLSPKKQRKSARNSGGSGGRAGVETGGIAEVAEEEGTAAAAEEGPANTEDLVVKGAPKKQHSINRGNKAAVMEQKTFSSVSKSHSTEEHAEQRSIELTTESNAAPPSESNEVEAADEDAEAGVQEDTAEDDDFEESLEASMAASHDSDYEDGDGDGDEGFGSSVSLDSSLEFDSDKLKIIKRNSIRALDEVDDLRASYDEKMGQLDETLDALKKIAFKVEDLKTNQEALQGKVDNISKSGDGYDEKKALAMMNQIAVLKAAWLKVHGEMLFGLERMADDSESDATGDFNEAKQQDQGKVFIQKALDLVQFLDNKLEDFNHRENLERTLKVLHPSLESIYRQALVLNNMDDKARSNDTLDKSFDDLICTDLTPSLKIYVQDALQKSIPVLDESIAKVSMKHKLDEAAYVLEHKANSRKVDQLESELKAQLSSKVHVDDFHAAVGRMATAAELQRLHSYLNDQLNKGSFGAPSEQLAVQVNPFKIEEANLFDNPDYRNAMERFDLLNKHMQELQRYCAQFVPRDEVHEAMKAVITEVKALKKSAVTHSIFREGLKMKADTVEVDRVVKTITDAIGDLNFATRSIDDPAMAAAVHAKCLVCDKPITSQRTRTAYKASRGSANMSASTPLLGYDKNSDESLKQSNQTHRIPQQSIFNKVTSADPAVSQSEKVRVATELAIVRSSIDPLPNINDSPTASPRGGTAPATSTLKERIRSSAGGGIGPGYKRDTR